MDKRPILLVEDNADDQYLTQCAFERAGVRNELIIVDSGEKGLAYLRGEGEFARRRGESPAVVLLDVNLPGLNGFQVMEEVRADPNLSAQPIIMLTSSDRDEDILLAYKSGANAYVRKPIAIEAFIDAILKLNMFWLVLNQNPHYRQNGGA